MATKNVTSQASRKNIRSLSQRSYQVGIAPCRWVHGMETRSITEPAMVVGVFKKIRNQKPDTRTEFSGTRTEIFIFFGSGTRTDNFIGLSVRVRIGLFTQTGTR